ncbi:unnamed protein product [Mesocestoides corti]|uniref:Saposin B-type domain-containing protein n=1 Tax=Mesocestoides corti TaxID=53468 RepID=A0A3P6GAB2_MESCO|nr:unnamed protein product [Mesocestoides corti]
MLLRMRPAWFCVLFIIFGIVHSKEADELSFSEGVTCRSYVAAKSNGLLDVCKNLWRNADISTFPVESVDCISCKHLLSSRNYKALAKLISTKETLRFRVRSTCDDCKKIIDDTRVLIKDNDTKSAVASFLKKSFCYELPLQIVDICKRTVDNYVGVIMDLAASELESGPICALFGLCLGERNLARTHNAPPAIEAYSWINRPAPVGFEFFHSRLTRKTEPEGSDTCTDCVNVFSRIRDKTEDPNFDKMLKDVVKDKLCESFGYFKAMCEAAVSKQVDAMIDNASKMNITDLCFFFGQCTEGVSAAAITLKQDLHRIYTQTPQRSDVEIPFLCPFCRYVIKTAIDATLDNRTVAAMAYALEQTCYLFSGETRRNCINFIETNADLIIKEVMAGTAPELICMAIGVCGPFQQPQPVDDSKCSICEVIVNTIYENLEANATKEKIIEELETVCSYLPYVKDQCINLVDEYASQVIDYLVDGVPPKEVCKKLGFCQQKVEDLQVEDSCAICEVVFIELYSKLRDNYTIEHIENALETVCNYIPTGYEDKAIVSQFCRSLVRENTPAIIDLVMQKVTPRSICETLGICYGRRARPTPGIGKCEICEDIIDFIYTKLEDGATADEIKKTLETVCDHLPGDNMKATCHEYVRAYTSVLINLLMENLPPREICQALHLCPSDQLVKRMCAGGPVAWCRDQKTAELCSRIPFCKEFIWGNNNDQHPRPSIVRKYDCSKLFTQEERCSNQRLMRLCGFVGFCADFKRPLVAASDQCRFCRNLLTQRLVYGSLSPDCSIYVNPLEKARCEKVRSVKLPGQLNTNSLDSVCKVNHCSVLLSNEDTRIRENGLCDEGSDSKPPMPNVLGDDPCLWGPSVTCRDADIASRCGATAYCQQNVWLADRPEGRRVNQVPGMKLVDCSRPLNEICVSPMLRYCGKSILDQCKRHVASASEDSKQDGDLRQRMCKDRPVSFCSDAKMVELCSMGEYCEAMSMAPTPAAPLAKRSKVTADPRCKRGPAFFCQSYQKAVLCGEVKQCRRRFWL